ncbi:MAG: hypothetical protein WBG92_22960 [Thiohalocapsa sp.]
MPQSVTSPDARERFLVRSLVEEAITSSQLEGASTTRKSAMQMCRSGRAPANKSERMIFNNLQGMQLIRDKQGSALTPDMLLSIRQRGGRQVISPPGLACPKSSMQYPAVNASRPA